MAEQTPKPGRRCQSSLIFTASDGRTISNRKGVSPQNSAKKLRVSLQHPLPPQQPLPPQPSLPSQQLPLQQADTSPWLFRRVSAPPGDLSNHSRHDTSRFYSPSKCATPSKPLRALNFAAEGPLPRTPSTSLKKCPLPSSTKKIKHRAAMKLKFLENERLEASRYEQDRSNLSLEAQEKAYTAWLNHVLLKPMKGKQSTHESESDTSSIVSNESKLSSFSDLSHISSDSVLTLGDRLSSSDFLSSPSGKKTPRPDKRNLHSKPYTGKQVKDGPPLDASFQAICSIPVLRSRLDPYLDARSREEVISTMINLAKHIDDGRLKMKGGCAILTDVALKENLIQAMLNYNAPWLRIGLHVVLGHSALLVQDNVKSMSEDPSQGYEDGETQQAVLRLIIEKHFLAHVGLAKYHATNKKIEGLYKQGYHEALARVILKRLLLLVLTLDKAKCQSTIPLACGIDGLDGGSPLLFNKNGIIKSSQHALKEILLKAMHGEGDIIGHLGVLGYHVAHMQAGLADYNFEITNMTEDLKDGVRLCRLVQVLLGDTSILKKVKIPTDHPRRRHYNCGIALERLARAGVPLTDASGYPIMADDLVEGDRNRVANLLWNIMVSLQIPALVSARRLCQEIARIHPCNMDVDSRLDDSSILNLLLVWIQATCMTFGFLVKNFTTSFADGQALCHLISYYYPMLLPQAAVQSSRPSKVSESPSFSGHSKASCGKNTEIKVVAAHNLAIFQLAIHKLGCIPEVLQLSHFVDDFPFVCEQSIIIMLVFLYNRMLEATPMAEEKMTALNWNAGLEITELSINELSLQAESNHLQNKLLAGNTSMDATVDWMLEHVVHQEDIRRQAATVLQAAVRHWLASKWQIKQKNNAAIVIQAHFRGWIARRECILIVQRSAQSTETKSLFAIHHIQAWWRKCHYRRAFMKKRAAAVLIQSHFRAYRDKQQYQILKQSVVMLQALAKGKFARRRYWKYKCAVLRIQECWRGVLLSRLCLRKQVEAVIRIQSHWRKHSQLRSFSRKKEAVIFLQRLWRKALASRLFRRKQVEAATELQSQWRKYRERKIFVHRRAAAIIIQRHWKQFLNRKLCIQKQIKAAVKLQSHWRKHILSKSFACKKAAALLIQTQWREILALRVAKQNQGEAAIKLQSQWRSHNLRKGFLKKRIAGILIQKQWRKILEVRQDKQRQIAAAIKLQCHWQCYNLRKSFLKKRSAAIFIQRVWREILAVRAAKQMQVAAVTKLQSHWRKYSLRKDFISRRDAVILIQKQWREILTVSLAKQKQVEAVLKIQCHWRKCKAKKSYVRKKAAIICIQSYVRGCLERKKYKKCRENVPKLQALVRGRSQRKRFCKLVESVKTIQHCWRNFQNRTQNEKRFMKVLHAAVKIQALWRGIVVRRSFLALKTATVDIQSSVRSYICKKRYKKLRESIIRLQAMARSRRARTNYRILRENVVKIQALYRGRKQQTRYKACRKFLTRIQATFKAKQDHQNFTRWKRAAITIQRSFREYLYHKKLLRTKRSFSAMRIQYAWRNMQSRRRDIQLQNAATIIQAHYRGWRQRCCYSMQVNKIIWLQSKVCETLHRCHQEDSQETCNFSLSSIKVLPDDSFKEAFNGILLPVISIEKVDSRTRLQSALCLQRWWRQVLQHRHHAATIIQKHFRSWQKHTAYLKAKSDIIHIQAIWRGFRVRNKQDHCKEGLSDLRQRMQSTAANIDTKMRLEYRLTEALAALLSQKTVSGILHTCATIDLATQHSKLCCERLLEAGAIPKLLQLIQTTNRSPPHEEILKHSLSILGNLARYPPFATLVANAPGSMTIVTEQLLRNNEEVVSKVLRLLQLISKVSNGLDAIQKNTTVIKRLNTISKALEKKVEMEARALARHPQNAVARRVGEKKVSEAVAQHHLVVLLLQKVTGEDLQTRLRAVKRLSSIYMVAPGLPRPSISRFPLQDCSNH